MRQISRRSGVLFLTLLSTLPFAAAQAPATATAPATKKAIFWKVSSPTNTVYLLGSIHLGSKDMYPLPPEIEEAFAGSSALLVEADIRHMDMSKAQAAILEKGLYPAGDSLWNHVSPDTRKKIEQFCDKYGMPAGNLIALKPWVVALTISTVPMMKAGMDPTLGIDMYFLNKSEKKRVVEIESADWQIDLLSGFADDLQEKFLAAAVDEGLDMDAELKRLRDAWSAGDAAKLDAITRENTKTPEKISRAILQDRNPHMADAAEQFLKGKEQAFLIVGAAHLVGDGGVVAILRKRGYKLEQVALKQ
jgi:uncharacterized protein YbaP (TraB family)